MTYQIIRVSRSILKFVVYAFFLLLLAGFVAQFLQPLSYPWVLTVRSYTRPVEEAIRSYLPTVYNDIDFSLLIVLVLLWIIYSRVDHGLWVLEDTARRREDTAGRQLTDAKFTTPVREHAHHQTQPVTPPPSSAQTPVYRSEAIAVIDLCHSTDLITRFGNTFLLTVKHRLEHHAGPIAARYNAGYSDFTGDGYLIFFPSVPKALAALQELMERVPAMNTDLPEGAEVALRAALNFGEILVDRDTQRTGSAIHKTFRLEAVGAPNLIEAKGGIRREEFPEKNYILVSEEAMTILEKVQGVQCRFLGHCEFKGFPGLHRVYKL